jgi:prepilin-type N-terminal cleavage/methylation domain-containing protein
VRKVESNVVCLSITEVGGLVFSHHMIRTDLKRKRIFGRWRSHSSKVSQLAHRIRSGGREGFTLIEVIITLVVMAIAATMLVSVMGTNLTKSAVPVGMVGDQYKTVEEMEKLTSQYRQQIQSGTLNLASFKATYVDTNTYVDTARTGFYTLSSTTGGTTYTSQSVLLVTLKDGDQYVQAIFTP